MKSLADLPNEYHRHRNFYRSIWGEISCYRCGFKDIKFRKNYEYCPHCKKKMSVKSETIFKGSNLSYRKIYMLIWAWQNKFGIGGLAKNSKHSIEHYGLLLVLHMAPLVLLAYCVVFGYMIGSGKSFLLINYIKSYSVSMPLFLNATLADSERSSISILPPSLFFTPLLF